MSLNLKEPDSANCAASVRTAGSTNVDIDQLIGLSIKGLRPMFVPGSELFCYRLTKGSGGLKQEGLSPRYTAMTLLGLCEFEKAGGESSFPATAMLGRLLENRDWPTSGGDFGLLLWLTAVRSPEKLPPLLSRLIAEDFFSRHVDLRQGRTMELAWLLTGLSHVALAPQTGLPDVSEIANKTYKLLVKNQGEGGFFGHLNTSMRSTSKLRGWLGSFADQVYPILAFTRFCEAFKQPEALERALACGLGICRVQGPLGQWWWHYDARSGRAADMYPVFSVHQEAMAPMALFPLAESTGRSFDEPIYRGLEWIGGANELETDMRDSTHNLIWRCIHPVPEFSMKVDVALSHLRIYRNASHRKMGILHECRPYELGWLLYAFSGRSGH